MTALLRSTGASGAETEISGTIAIYATWQEDLYFFDQDGAAVDLTDLDFYMQFRCDPANTSADVTLSTAAGTLSIEDDEGAVASILRINAAAGTFSAYSGDMIVDLVAVDPSDDVTLYGHGVVSLRNNPVAI